MLMTVHNYPILVRELQGLGVPSECGAILDHKPEIVELEYITVSGFTNSTVCVMLKNYVKFLVSISVGESS